MKKIIATMLIIATVCLSTSVLAENIGVCTHISHPHTGNSVWGIIDRVDDIAADYMRDELRWGWGMQPSKTAELKIPEYYWIDAAENIGVNSLVILGFGNPAWDENETIPKIDNTEYFNAFLEYVRFVVKNCKNKVEAYEIWNEPNHGPFNYEIANGLPYEPSDYVELVKAVSAVIEEEDKEAKIVGGCYFTYGTKHEGWIEGLFEAGIGNYIDALSIHVYTDGIYPEKEMARHYADIETVMDNYGFDGEIWLTETGYSSATGDITDEEQASYAIRTKILWDNYLKNSGRKGEFFWYVIRNNGKDASSRADNYGIIDYHYNEKPAYSSIKLYNELLSDRVFDVLDTKGSTSYNMFRNEAKYKDETTGDYTHILYGGKYTSGNVTVPLSGNIAYLYDYQGNIVNTYTNTNQNITVNLTENPQIVHCVSYKTSIDALEYDADKNVCTLSGKTNIPNNELTVTLSKNNNYVQSETAKVKNGIFNIQFSPSKDGEYVLSVGKEELETLNSEFYDTKEFFVRRNAESKETSIEYVIAAEYDKKTMIATVNGKLRDLITNENADGVLNVLVLKEETDIDKVEGSDVIYVKDVTTQNGEFTVSFKINNADSSKYRLYLKELRSDKEDSGFGNVESGKFVYTFDFIKNDEMLQLKASLGSVDENVENAVMVISQYNEDGIIIEVSTKEVIKDSGEILMEVSKNSSAVSYRAYMWDGLTGMRPIAPMAEIR